MRWLEAEGRSAYRMFDFMTRANGWSLVMIGWLMAAVLWFGFRRDERWAWWTMWFIPAWAAGIGVFYLVAGVDPARLRRVAPRYAALGSRLPPARAATCRTTISASRPAPSTSIEVKPDRNGTPRK